MIKSGDAATVVLLYVLKLLLVPVAVEHDQLVSMQAFGCILYPCMV